MWTARSTSNAAASMLSSGQASDKLCREYGLSVVEQPKAKEPARYARMREAIDQACEDASTAEDFHRALYRQGISSALIPTASMQ